MKHAAIGVRMHSGWGVLVAVSNDGGRPSVIARERIVVIDEKTGGKKQPYHFAKTMAPGKAKEYIASCADKTQRLAREALCGVAEDLRKRGYRLESCTVLTASGRELPELRAILAAHPLIHTAEGEFFREAIAEACDSLKVSVSRMREREVEKEAKAALGKSAVTAMKKIANAGKALGSPWTQEHKKSALAAWISLA